MKGCLPLAFLAVLTALCAAPATAADLSPVTRVAELLKGLADKIDSELEAEENLYESYVCWAKTVVSTKTESNAKAQSRVDSLKTYLADLAAGRIELTTERSDLEKEVGTLMSDLETAKALRDKNHAEYEDAVDEMDKAISAMKEAIKVLDDATKDSKSALVSMKSFLNQRGTSFQGEGFSQRTLEGESLERAVQVGHRYLSSGDAAFLQRLLYGEVPQKDWKKLNRKADFKMKYKARSVKIQDTLSKLLQSFEKAKKDAEDKEDEEVKTYDKLKDAKTKLLKESQSSLRKMESEGGAAGVSKADAKAEIDALETQITDDTKYIGQTEDDLKEKKKEWVTRKGLRLDEIAAINEAVGVIRSDDAKDLFKKSLASQASFLQLFRSSSLTEARQAAAGAIRTAAKSDSRLKALAMRVEMAKPELVGDQDGFKKVFSMIDKLVQTLKDEQDDDDENKKECETDRASDTKEAAELSRDIDELSDDNAKLEGEIKEFVEEIDEKNTSIKELKAEMKEAKQMREDENTEWKQSDKDDQGAIDLMEKSMTVLKSFYAKTFGFVQENAKKGEEPYKMGEVTAGEAPPPPPATWDTSYGGAQKEKTGIISIMELVKKDMEKDKADAKKDEDDAQDKYDKFVETSKKTLGNLEGAIDKLEEKKAKAEDDIKDNKKTMGTKKGSLETVIEKLKDAKPGCDFLLVNYEVRSSNRDEEIAGLKKAKKILEDAH